MRQRVADYFEKMENDVTLIALLRDLDEANEKLRRAHAARDAHEDLVLEHMEREGYFEEVGDNEDGQTD